MANYHISKGSTPLVIRVMQIKTTLIYQHTPLRMPITKLSDNLWRDCKGQEEYLCADNENTTHPYENHLGGSSKYPN